MIFFFKAIRRSPNIRAVLAILLTLFGNGYLYSQSQRLVLIEHFTQASSAPCALANPLLQQKLDFNEDKMIGIKYQVSWPGQDVMNTQNPYQVASRVNYYGITNIPYTQADGNKWHGATGDLTMDIVDSMLASPSPFEITLNHSFSLAKDTVFVVMKVKALLSVSGNMVAHLAIVENQIHFNSSPGSNGETDFYNVMKRMLPNELGTPLPFSMSQGDSIIISESWALANVYDVIQIAAIAYVQDNSTKLVHQAAYSPPIAPSHNDVSVYEIMNPPDIVCGSNIVPEMSFRNMGEVLTSMDIAYSINGGQDSIYHWAGDVRFLGYTKVKADTIDFIMQPTNEFRVYTANPNGGTDSIPANDTASKIFDDAYITTNKVYLELKTDNYPEETTWKLLDYNDSVMYSGGPYPGNANVVIYDTFTLPSDCYNFEIYDEFGDGICCGWGNGYYKLLDENNFIFINGGFFNFTEVTPFRVDISTSRPNYEPETEILVFPNPAVNSISVAMEVSSVSDIRTALYDMRGNLLYLEEENNVAPGNFILILDVKEYSAGIYYLRTEINNHGFSQKITIVH